MRTFLIVALLIAAVAILLVSQNSIAQGVPDLKGTWSGTFRTVIYGRNVHHPGTQTVASPPRVRSIRFTLDVEGQDGRLFWGHSWSNPSQKEPFAATITSDGRTIIGADTDGTVAVRILSLRLLEVCCAHSALGPSGSIVASCGTVVRSP